MLLLVCVQMSHALATSRFSARWRCLLATAQSQATTNCAVSPAARRPWVVPPPPLRHLMSTPQSQTRATASPPPPTQVPSFQPRTPLQPCPFLAAPPRWPQCGPQRRRREDHVPQCKDRPHHHHLQALRQQPSHPWKMALVLPPLPRNPPLFKMNPSPKPHLVLGPLYLWTPLEPQPSPLPPIPAEMLTTAL